MGRMLVLQWRPESIELDTVINHSQTLPQSLENLIRLCLTFTQVSPTDRTGWGSVFVTINLNTLGQLSLEDIIIY